MQSSTESRVAEREFGYYRDLFFFAPDPTLITDEQGIIEEANDRAARALRVPAASLVGDRMVDYLGRGHHVFRQRLRELNSASSSEPFFGKLWPREGGEPFLAELAGRRVSTSRGFVIVWTARHCPGPASTHRDRTPNNQTPPPVAVALNGLSVLLIYDDEAARPRVQRILVSHGADVEGCVSSKEALAVVARQRIDVAIVDLELHDDAYALVSRLKSAPVRNEPDLVPAIALTRLGAIDESRRAISAGYQALVTKPIDEMLLTHAIVNISESARVIA
jgi:CheY-like chemotaxis protein